MDRYTYGERPKERSRTGRIMDFIMLLATILFAVLLICAYFARKIDPNDAWFFAFAGLTAPVLYVGNILLALFWVVRWRWYILIPVATVLIGIGSVPLFFRPSLSKDRADGTHDYSVVMSYNVAGFLTKNSDGKNVSSLDSVVAFVDRIAPDIVCFQEFQAANLRKKTEIDSLIGLPYKCVSFSNPNRSGGGWGVAIYSRYPIVKHDTLKFERSANSAIWADIAVESDTVRVFSCHLQTTQVGQSDRDYIDRMEYLGDNNREERVRNIAGSLKRNFKLRAVQADTLAKVISESPYRTVVCGDFNDTPMSYAYHTVRGDMLDAFVEKGRGVPSTYKGLFNLFRIDYVLFSKEIKAVSYNTPPGEYSDHKAVVVELDMRPRAVNGQ